MGKKEKLKEIFMKKFNIEITEENSDKTFKQLGMDSMKAVELFVEVEDVLKCDLYSLDIDFVQLKTFNKLLNVLEENFQ